MSFAYGNPDIPANYLFLATPENDPDVMMTITSKIPTNRVIGIAVDMAWALQNAAAADPNVNRLEAVSFTCFSENV